MLQRDPWLRALIVLGVAIAALHLGAQLWALALHFGDIIVLFFLAWLLAFVLRPVVRSLELVVHLPRLISAIVVYVMLLIAIGLVVGLIVPLMITQLVEFANTLPAYAEEMPRVFAVIDAELRRRNIALDLPSVFQAQNVGTQLERVVSGLVENTVTIIGGLASTVVALSIILVLSFYFVVDGERLLKSVLSSVPDPYEGEARLFFESVGQAFGGYLRGTLIQMGIFVVGTAAVMWWANLPYLVLVSVLAGLLVVVPFVGPTLAILPPILIAALTLPTWGSVLLVAGALLVLQIIVVNVVVPKVMGDSVGLHPLVVFLALLVGAKQAGLAGALFGVPAAAVAYASLLILLRRALRERPSTEGVPRPSRQTAVVGQSDRLERLRTSVGGAFKRRFPDNVGHPTPTPAPTSPAVTPTDSPSAAGPSEPATGGTP